MAKSYVSLEQKICCVCGRPYDTNSILLDRRLKDSMEPHTVTGWGLCPDDEKKQAEGYVALIEVNNNVKSSTLNQEQADRTGRVAYLKRHLLPQCFRGIPEEKLDSPAMFIESEVFQLLEKLERESRKKPETPDGEEESDAVL